jgi:hypothetical protein
MPSITFPSGSPNGGRRRCAIAGSAQITMVNRTARIELFFMFWRIAPRHNAEAPTWRRSTEFWVGCCWPFIPMKHFVPYSTLQRSIYLVVVDALEFGT